MYLTINPSKAVKVANAVFTSATNHDKMPKLQQFFIKDAATESEAFLPKLGNIEK